MQIARNRTIYALYLYSKIKLWESDFQKILVKPKSPNFSSIFQDLSTLRLSKHYILHFHYKFKIYDLFFFTIIWLVGKLISNISLERLLCWTRLSSIKPRKICRNYMLTIFMLISCIFVTRHYLIYLYYFYILYFLMI